jgi:hypothetical protein
MQRFRPGFPDRFGSIQDGHAFCQNFLPWYNCEHRHSGIGLLTPEMVHYGKAASDAEHHAAWSQEVSAQSAGLLSLTPSDESDITPGWSTGLEWKPVMLAEIAAHSRFQPIKRRTVMGRLNFFTTRRLD